MEVERTIDGPGPRRTEQRIAWLTPAIGGVAGLAVWLAYGWRWGAGLVIGALLAWLNFRWMKSGLDALQRASMEQAGRERPHVPAGTWFKLAGRYALIGFCAYAIFVGFRIPIVSMLVGLCSLGAATMAASVYEILRPAE